MALGLGIHHFSARITTNTDTSLLGAPGVGKAIVLREIFIDLEDDNTDTMTVRIENGAASGDILAALNAATGENKVERVFHVRGGSRGQPLSENTALSAESANAGVAVVRGSAEVVGGIG